MLVGRESALSFALYLVQIASARFAYSSFDSRPPPPPQPAAKATTTRARQARRMARLGYAPGDCFQCLSHALTVLLVDWKVVDATREHRVVHEPVLERFSRELPISLTSGHAFRKHQVVRLH